MPTIPRKQRFLKIFILLMMPIMVIAALGALAGTFWFSFSGEKYLSAADSPSGHFRAVIAKERDSICGEGVRTGNSIFLKLERRKGFVKTGEFIPFCVASDDSDSLRVHWSGADELTIECLKCSDGMFDFYDGNWGEATFRLNAVPANQLLK